MTAELRIKIAGRLAASTSGASRFRGVVAREHLVGPDRWRIPGQQAA